MLTPKRDTDPGLPCQNTSLLLEIWEPVPPQLPSPVPRNLFLLSYYFQVLKKHMFYLKIQKSCQNKNYTKDASVTFTQIHLLTSYPICSIVCSVFYIWVYVNPSLPEPFEGKLHTSFILHCCVHFPSIRISNNRKLSISVISHWHNILICLHSSFANGPSLSFTASFLLQHRSQPGARHSIQLSCLFTLL